MDDFKRKFTSKQIPFLILGVYIAIPFVCSAFTGEGSGWFGKPITDPPDVIFAAAKASCASMNISTNAHPNLTQLQLAHLVAVPLFVILLYLLVRLIRTKRLNLDFVFSFIVRHRIVFTSIGAIVLIASFLYINPLKQLDHLRQWGRVTYKNYRNPPPTPISDCELVDLLEKCQVQMVVHWHQGNSVELQSGSYVPIGSVPNQVVQASEKKCGFQIRNGVE